MKSDDSDKSICILNKSYIWVKNLFLHQRKQQKRVLSFNNKSLKDLVENVQIDNILLNLKDQEKILFLRTTLKILLSLLISPSISLTMKPFFFLNKHQIALLKLQSQIVDHERTFYQGRMVLQQTLLESNAL